jgi:hypothetical protein
LAQPATTIERLRKLIGVDFDLCPRRGVGHLSRAAPIENFCVCLSQFSSNELSKALRSFLRRA